MVASRAIDSFLHFFDLINVSWRVLQAPKGSLDEIILPWVQLVNSYRLHILLRYLSSFGMSMHSIRKLLPFVDLLKSFILLKGFQFHYFYLHLFFFFHHLLLLYNLFNISLLVGYSFLLLHQKLNNAGTAENMSLITAGRLNEAIIADGAHLELLDGVLTNSGFIGSVDSFELLTLAVGED